MSITDSVASAEAANRQAVLRRVPGEVLAALAPAQREALIAALAAPAGSHRLELRASVPCLGRRYYVTVLAGRERRSLERLAREGQLDVGRALAVYAVIGAVLLGPVVVLVAVAAGVSRLAGVEGLEPPLTALHEMMHRH